MKPVPGGLLAVALGWSTLAHADDPSISFRWLDRQGTPIVSPHEGGVPRAQAEPETASCRVHQLQLGEEGVRIRDCRDRYLAAEAEDGVRFQGEATGTAGLFSMIRHRDGAVSFQAHDGTLLYRHESGVIRRTSLNKPDPGSTFTVADDALAANKPGPVPLDCSPERIETIRSQYAQLTSAKDLKTLDETRFSFGDNARSTSKQGNAAHQRVEHIVDTAEFAGYERFAYFWDAGEVPFFVYEIYIEYEDNVRVESRTYYEGTTPCRCVRKVGKHSLEHDPAAFAELPDQQIRCP